MNDNHAIFVVPETLDKALKSYILAVRTGGSKSYTVTVYERSIRKLIHYLASQGARKMEDVTAEQLREFFVGLQENHNAGGV